MTPSELRDLRKQRRITILELSRLTGLPQQLLALYEQGDKLIPAETAETLMTALERREKR